MFLDELSRILRLKVPADQKIKLAQEEMENITLAEEAMELERIKLLRRRFAGGDIRVGERNLTQFSIEQRVDLTTANTNKLIWERPFKSLSITQLRPLPGDNNLPSAYIRLAGKAGPLYKVQNGYIKGNFREILLTNAAQSGKSFDMVISSEENAEWRMLGDIDELITQVMGIKGLAVHRTLSDIWDQGAENLRRATTPTPYNVTMTNADAEYSQALPTACKKFLMHTRDESEFRYAFVTGKVAAPTEPYFTVLANSSYGESGLYLTGRVVYFASSVAGKVMEIVVWV